MAGSPRSIEGLGAAGLKRSEMLARARARREPWDMVVIGGGATGVGVAVDAAARGYEVLLLEQNDFGKGTSSRSTKLVHGGVRYLEQGNVSLVMEALKERGLLRRNAPHLVGRPGVRGAQLRLVGGAVLRHRPQGLQPARGHATASERPRSCRASETLERLPTIKTEGLRGGVVYYDGQFDDARLLINLAATAAEQGATLLNYAPVTGLSRDADGFVDGVAATRSRERRRSLGRRAGRDQRGRPLLRRRAPARRSGRRAHDRAQPGDPPRLRRLASCPGAARSWCPTRADGRVMFAIPWHGRTLVGTTDTPVDEAALEPRPREEEIDFILETAPRYPRGPVHPRGRPERLRRHPPSRPLRRRPEHGRPLARPHDPHRRLRAS